MSPYVTPHIGLLPAVLFVYGVPAPFVSDIAIFVLKRDVKLQLTNYRHLFVLKKHSVHSNATICRLCVLKYLGLTH